MYSPQQLLSSTLGRRGSKLALPLRREQGCARLIFFRLTRLWLIWRSRCFNSDSTQHFTFCWLNSDSTRIRNLLNWLNSDSTHLSRSWVKSDSPLFTFYIIWPKFADRGGGGRGVRSNVAVGWFFPSSATSKCQILTFSLQKNQWYNFDLSSIQLTQLWLKWRSAWLNSDSTHIIDFHNWLNSDSTNLSLSRLSSQIWLTTHESNTTLEGSTMSTSTTIRVPRVLPAHMALVLHTSHGRCWLVTCSPAVWTCWVGTVRNAVTAQRTGGLSSMNERNWCYVFFTDR